MAQGYGKSGATGTGRIHLGMNREAQVTIHWIIPLLMAP
jgi:hypothetical protein